MKVIKCGDSVRILVNAFRDALCFSGRDFQHTPKVVNFIFHSAKRLEPSQPHPVVLTERSLSAVAKLKRKKEVMKHLIASVSVAALAALSAGAVSAADSAVESEEFEQLAYPNDRGSKNYSTVAPDASNGNGAEQIPTTAAAQGGRDQAVYKDANEGTTGTPDITVRENAKADSAVESEEFKALAFPDDRGSKNYADVAPDASNGNGSEDIPRAAAAQGGRDEAVFDTSTVTQ